MNAGGRLTRKGSRVCRRKMKKRTRTCSREGSVRTRDHSADGDDVEANGAPNGPGEGVQERRNRGNVW